MATKNKRSSKVSMDNSAIALITETIIKNINKRFAVIDQQIIVSTVKLYEYNNDVDLSKYRESIIETIMNNYKLK